MIDAVFRLDKQYFTVGETVTGEIVIDSHNERVTLKNGYLSLVVQEKFYHPIEDTEDKHSYGNNIETYPFYNLKYQLFQKKVLSETEKIPFKLLLPYNAPGTYNGHIASCNWYLKFECDVQLVNKLNHFAIAIELAVFSREYSIEI